MTKASIRYNSAKTLMISPNLPRENELFNSGRLRRRSKAMDPIEIMYEDERATVPRAVSWLKAMVDPKEMLIRRMEATAVAKMALSGMSRPGRTYSRMYQRLVLPIRRFLYDRIHSPLRRSYEMARPDPARRRRVDGRP